MLRRRYLQFCKALALSRNPVFRKGLLLGIGATIEHHDILSALAPEVVVDIGANVGQFSLLARGLFPAANVYAFGRRQMHVSARDDSSSLLPISPGQVEFAPGTQEARREDVVLAPLDQFIRAEDIAGPALLKLDVQGFELEALKGCETLLSRFNHIYVEISFFPLYEGQVLAAELIEWLAARGFHVSAAGNPSYGKDRRIVQMDMLFTRAA